MESQGKQRQRGLRSEAAENLAADLIENPSRWLQEIPALVSKLRSFPEEELEIFSRHLLAEGGEPVFPLLEALTQKEDFISMALARGAGHGNSPFFAEFLKRWASRNPSKKLAKEIRKSVFRLKSRGIAVEEIEDLSPGVFHAPQSSVPEGYVSALDAAGYRFIWLGKPQIPQGMVMINSLVSDTEGIVDFQAFESSRKKFHEYMNQMRKDMGWEIGAADPLYCNGLIHEAHATHIRKGKTPNPEYLKFRSLLEPSAPLPIRPLIYQYLTEEEIRTHSELGPRFPSLFQTPSFERWYLGKEEVGKYLSLLEEASQSRIILAPHQKEGRFFDIYRQAVHELFDGARRSLYRRRLEEMAYLLWEKGRQADARISLAAALELCAEEKILSPHLFLLELVKRSLIALMGEKQEEKEKEKGGLIIQPG